MIYMIGYKLKNELSILESLIGKKEEMLDRFKCKVLYNGEREKDPLWGEIEAGG